MPAERELIRLHLPFNVLVAPGRALPRSVRVFVLVGRRAHAIDAGVAGHDVAILEALSARGQPPAALATLLLTHGHPDHLGGASQLAERSGARVMGGAGERAWIETPDVQHRERPVPGFEVLVAGGVRLDRALADGDRVELEEGLTLEVIGTPGHSPGHLAFWEPRRRWLFSGDAVPVPGDLPIYDDAARTLASLERLQQLGEVRWLLSAWDEPREGAAAARALADGIEVVRGLQRKIDELIRDLGTASDDEVTSALLGKLGLPPGLHLMLKRTVRAHREL
jgi:glyoxylase-like metal-dependent hydrolase (beta-lactamase superfamily II)